MNTEQRYAGRGNNAQPIEQTAAQPTLTADQRREKIADLTQDHSEVIDEYTEKLFEAATDLCERTHGRSPVTLLTDLLEYWLLNTDPSMRVDSHKDRVQGTFAAIQSIDRISKIVAEIQYFRGEIINMQEQLEILDQQGKGSNGNDKPVTTSPIIAVTPPTPQHIALWVDVVEANSDPNNYQPSELHVLRDALLYYKDHLLDLGEKTPSCLLTADTVNDMLENLTAEAFTTLSSRSIEVTQSTRKGVSRGE